MPTPEIGQWVHRPLRRATFAISGAIGAIAMVAIGALVESVAIPQGDALAIVFGLGVVVVGAAFARFAYGAWRAGVLITTTEVVVVSPWAKESFPLGDVDRFGPAALPAEGANPTPGVALWLRDGAAVPVWALGKEGLVWNTEQNVAARSADADALNRTLDAARDARRG